MRVLLTAYRFQPHSQGFLLAKILFAFYQFVEIRIEKFRLVWCVGQGILFWSVGIAGYVHDAPVLWIHAFQQQEHEEEVGEVIDCQRGLDAI
jgi:hypothetical protein